MNANRFPRVRRWLALAVLVGGVALIPRPAAPAADHRDGPVFGPPGITITNSRRDINDVYLFRSPANASNTVFVVTLSPFAGVTTPGTFDTALVLDIRVDSNGNGIENLTFRTTFGPPDANGIQDVTVRALPSGKFPPTGIVARGKTGTNIPIAGGGMFRAAIQDDPFFFDAVGFNQLLNGGPFPRPVGTAANFFGPAVNTLAIVLEIPSTRLQGPASNPNNLIAVWATSTINNVQIDRMGRPAINTALIPPVPRGSNFPIGQGGQNRQDRRNAFNAGLPRNDRRDFRSDMGSVLTAFYGRNAADTAFLTSALLPDVLLFQLGNPGGFGTLVGPGPGIFTGPFAGGQVLGNGRQFRDDVIDIEVNLLTNGAFPGDNVGDDNGLKVTDGSVDPVSMQTRPIAFPYIGAPNNPATGLPGPQPPP
jgi:hypothetical protein